MMRSRASAIVVVVVMLASAAAAYGPSAADAESDLASSVTTTTVPPRPDQSALSQIPEEQLPAVEQFAQDYGLTLDRAWAALTQQAKLTDYADGIRSSVPGYAGFKVTMTPTGEARGVLAVLDPSTIEVPADLLVTVIPATLPESSIPSFSAAMTATVNQGDLQSVVEGVTYDPFQDTVIAWVSSSDSARAQTDTPTIVDALRQSLPSSFDATSIRVDVAPSTSYNYGGLKEFKTSSFLWFHWTSGQCTSAFGVVKSIGGSLTGGYLTAAHCKVLGGTGWKIAHPSGDKTVNAYYNQSFGGYKDRIVFQAAGASWLTKTSSSTTQDMAATATHIYKGTYYCHYGSRSNVQQCGTIQQVNVPVTDQGYTVYTSLQQTDKTCIAGDSGGPVWRPGSPSTPAGTIEASRNSDRTCMYLALDDQLSGSGWTLL